MIRLRLALATVLISFSVVQYAQSAIMNGRFETGDFSGWTVGGRSHCHSSAYHTITGTGFGLGPIQGTSSALMVARSGLADAIAMLYQRLGCRVSAASWRGRVTDCGARRTRIGISTRSGFAEHPDQRLTSWIGQDIQGQAGDEIDLSLQFLTNELGLVRRRLRGLRNACPEPSF